MNSCSRDPKIKENISRMLNIWRQRNVYDPSFIDELIEILGKGIVSIRKITLNTVPINPVGACYFKL